LDSLDISVTTSVVLPPEATDHSITIGETLVLASLVASLQPKAILEIGTGTGFTSLIMSINVPITTRVTTIDLPILSTRKTLKTKIKPIYWNQDLDSNSEAEVRLREQKNVSREFMDSADLGQKVEQSFDLIFIDGCHDYSYVVNDSQHAFRLIKPGGLVVWHDYGMLPDVSRYLDEISRVKDVHVIRGTRFALWRCAD
jgi:predicted O-methyltransferase YrrM